MELTFAPDEINISKKLSITHFCSKMKWWKYILWAAQNKYSYASQVFVYSTVTKTLGSDYNNENVTKALVAVNTTRQQNQNSKLWLSLRKPSLMAHLLLQEKPIWSIQATVALLCWTLATPDLQYN